MTPLHLFLGDGGPTLLLWVLGFAAVLTVIAAGLEIALERAGGPDPAALPDWFAERGPLLFLFGGLPATLVAVAITVGLVLALGGNPERSGMPLVWIVLLDSAALVAVLGLGIGSPLTRHWGLGVTTVAAGVSLIFPLLYISTTLAFTDSGALAYPERLVFAVTVGLMLLTAVIAVAALVSLAVTGVRSLHALRHRHDARPSLTLMERR